MPVAKPTPTTRIVSYVVRSGDNLTAIAARYKVSLSAVSSRNHLRPDGLIFIGQRLQIEVPVPVTKAPTSFAGRTYPPATLAARPTTGPPCWRTPSRPRPRPGP